MSEFGKLMTKYFAEYDEGLHTAIIGEITRLTGRTAEVQPKHADYPLLINVALLKQSYAYAVGDTVLVVFAERAIDGIGQRRHSLDDGVVVGVIQ